MAKLKHPADQDKNKLDLGSTLYALDMRNKKYYSNLSDDEKKKYVPLILMRFMSSASDQQGLHEYHIQAVNELVNLDFWTLSKHPELLHNLLATCGVGVKQYHSWIAGPKNQKDNKIRKIFQKLNPEINEIEYKLLLSSYSREDFKGLCEDLAMEDKEIKDHLAEFDKVKK